MEESKKKEKLEKKKVEDLQKKLKESDTEKSELSSNLTQLRSDRFVEKFFKTGRILTERKLQGCKLTLYVTGHPG